MPASSSIISTQSPAVMSPTMPPLAAIMVAIRHSALFLVWVFEGSWRHSDTSFANPCGSRLRAISAVRICTVAGVSSHDRLGRVAADQHQDGAAQRVEGAFLPGAAAVVVAQPPDDAVSPGDVAGCVGAADQPPVLPGLPGIVLQPAQDLADASAVAGLRAGRVEHERCREQPR